MSTNYIESVKETILFDCDGKKSLWLSIALLISNSTNIPIIWIVD